MGEALLRRRMMMGLGMKNTINPGLWVELHPPLHPEAVTEACPCPLSSLFAWLLYLISFDKGVSDRFGNIPLTKSQFWFCLVKELQMTNVQLTLGDGGKRIRILSGSGVQDRFHYILSLRLAWAT